MPMLCLLMAISVFSGDQALATTIPDGHGRNYYTIAG